MRQGNAGEDRVQDFWETRVPGIRTKLEEREPEVLPRLEQLASLKATLDAYSEALESSIIGCDPDDPGPEAVFGDTPMEETIELLRTLSTIRAEIPGDVMERAAERGWRPGSAGNRNEEGPAASSPGAPPAPERRSKGNRPAAAPPE